MKIGSLFSGIGGIELGFDRAGFTTEWFVEYDEYAQSVLRKHWPNTTIYGDITEIDWRTVPKVDILTGGFPCQDISNAGKRVGITGSRSSLWKYYLKAIGAIRPRYAVIENVAALANRGLNVVLADLAEIGYDAEWYNISASAVGALHRRERLFIIAYPNNSRCFYGQAAEQPAERGEYAQRELEPVCEDVADTTKPGQLRKKQLENNSESERARWGFNTNESSEIPRGQSEDVADTERILLQGFNNRQGERESWGGGWWATEPDVGRVAHGIPNRVDRIKCLGNAVVPQVAEVIALAIKEYEEGSQGPPNPA